MADLLDSLRNSRKNPSVLKHALISVRSFKSNDLIFIFEGIEDIGVYESWIAKSGVRLTYEPLAGKGKEQLLALRELLRENSPELLRKVYFFVDCDFDEYSTLDHHVFVLDAYSIENELCGNESLESILSDEFRCAGAPKEREKIIGQFIKIVEEFTNYSSQVNFSLFAARRCGVKVLKKPDDAKEITEVQLTQLTPAFSKISDIVELEREIEHETFTLLKTEFDTLSYKRAQRGKYVISLLREWLKSLTADRKRADPILFNQSMPNLRGEPWSVPLRRLATPSPVPTGLAEFLSKAALSV